MNVCIQSGKCPQRARRWACNSFTKGRSHHPINCVEVEDAEAYCAWQGKRLPTAAEWEWAARGGDQGRLYPWGAEPPDCARATKYGFPPDPEGPGCGTGSTTPVGSKPLGTSLHGAVDLAGNVLEITRTERPGIYGILGGGFLDMDPENFRADRGGNEVAAEEMFGSIEIGFRCASSPPDRRPSEGATR